MGRVTKRDGKEVGEGKIFLLLVHSPKAHQRAAGEADLRSQGLALGLLSSWYLNYYMQLLWHVRIRLRAAKTSTRRPTRDEGVPKGQFNLLFHKA